MVKARILAALVLAIMLLGVFVPGSGAVASVESPPSTPVNYSPDNGALEISPLHTLVATALADNLSRGQWQIMQSDAAPALDTDGSYDKPLWDSGLVGVESVTPPVGLLEYGQKYWWHLRVQDITGAWSAWSTQTWFTVMANLPPNQPINESPANGATGVSVTPILNASPFSDPDPTGYDALSESLAAAEWQVTATAGNYANPVATHGGAATSVVVLPAAKLSPSTTYYWHVRYQDNHGNWSAWSLETSFTTKDVSKPVAVFTADKASVVAGQDLITFTDNSTPAGEIDRWVWDFGDGSSENWTTLDRPSDGKVTHKYTTAPEDNKATVKLTVYNSASQSGVSKTMVVGVRAKPAASFTLPASAKAGAQIAVEDTSGPDEEISTWEWQIDGATVATWASAADKTSAGGVLNHTFDKSGTHTVSLTITGALGESFYTKEIKVTGGGGFHFGLWMIAVAVAVVVVAAGAVYLLRSRKAK